MRRKREDRVARESAYRAAYHALWLAAMAADSPAVLTALRRFQDSAIALSLAPASRIPKRGEHDRWPRA